MILGNLSNYKVLAVDYENVPTAEIAINGKAVNGINPIKIDGTYYLPIY